jgi:hypothetical protein
MEGPPQYILFINYFLSWPEANLTADLDEKRYIVLAYLTKVKKHFKDRGMFLAASLGMLKQFYRMSSRTRSWIGL